MFYDFSRAKKHQYMSVVNQAIAATNLQTGN